MTAHPSACPTRSLSAFFSLLLLALPAFPADLPSPIALQDQALVAIIDGPVAGPDDLTGARLKPLPVALPWLAHPETRLWIRISLESSATGGGRGVLEIGNPLLVDSTLWMQTDQGWQAMEPVSPRLSPLMAYRVPAPGSGAILWLRAEGPLTEMPLHLWTSNAYVSAKADERLAVGGFFGILLAMALYHLLMWLTIRERAYLWYVALISCVTASMFAWEGWALHSLWPGAITWNRTSLPLLDAASAWAGIQFARSYLDAARWIPRHDRVLSGLRWLCALAVVLAVPITWTFSVEVVGLISILGPAVMLSAGVWSWKAGYRPARFYLAALVLFLVGLITEVTLVYAGQAVEIAAVGTYLGAVAMVVLFSLGLADRYRTIVRERERVESENRVLQIASYKDGLTGVWNRRAFDENLDEAWRRCARESLPVALMMMDVDHFKLFNDTYGHQGGDDCLRKVATALERCVSRPADRVSRYGGEEFAVLLPGVDWPAARDMAEILRARVEGLGIPHRQSDRGQVTVSVGLAVARPGPDQPVDGLVKAADAALYAAKKGGRNRVATDDSTESEDG